MEESDRSDWPVGVLDSGVGGISVLRTARSILPSERFLYYGDTAHGPYGEKSLSEIRRLTLRAAAELAGRGVKALLVACNTATAAGIDELRARYDFPVLGMEPALKPAMEDGRPGCVVVMATPATLHLEKFALLMHRFPDGDRIVPLPCPGLARLIETAGPGSAAVAAALRGFLSQVGGRPVGAVVLGCTHYSFIVRDIAALLPEAAVYDGNRGTAFHLKRILEEAGLARTRPSTPPPVEFLSSDPSGAALALFRRFLDMEI
jgi:glutamate racemase